jgi:hypothetical protein
MEKKTYKKQQLIRGGADASKLNHEMYIEYSDGI